MQWFILSREKGVEKLFYAYVTDRDSDKAFNIFMPQFAKGKFFWKNFSIPLKR